MDWNVDGSCPFCGEYNVDIEHQDNNKKDIQEWWVCLNPDCKKEWYAYYKLTHIEEIK